jgi:glycosyltransferase involved in cell wall biosynthesis
VSKVGTFLIVAPGLWHAPDLARGLQQLGHRVRIVGMSQDRPTTRLLTRATLRVAGRWPLTAPAITAPLGMTARLNVRSSPDAVFAWSSFALASEVRRQAPVVVVRGSTHIRTQRHLLAAAPPRSRPSPMTVRLEEVEYRNADAVTVPTQQIADDPHWKRQHVCPIVTPYGFPGISSYGHPERHTTARDGLRLVFGGAVSYRKGLDRLSSALRVRPPSVSSFELFGNLSEGIDSRSLPEWWTLRGHAPRAEWQDALNQAHLLVLPSREEGMARVGQEAMACGVPVIATPESGLGLWLGEGGGIEMPHQDWVPSLSTVLARVQAEWTHFSSRAAATAESWTWRDHASLLLAQIGFA